MRQRIRALFSFVVLVAVFVIAGVSGIQLGVAHGDEFAPRCNCWYPNTNEYGVKEWVNGQEDCVKKECWIEVE